jgi:hypothetical protein
MHDPRTLKIAVQPRTAMAEPNIGDTGRIPEMPTRLLFQVIQYAVIGALLTVAGWIVTNCPMDGIGPIG